MDFFTKHFHLVNYLYLDISEKKMLLETLYYISIISPLAALFIGIKQRFSLLWIYTASGFVTEIISNQLGEYRHVLGNFFLLLEFFLISFYYRKLVYKKMFVFIVVMTSISIYFICNTISSSILVFNFWGGSLFCAVYVSYGFFGFYSILMKQQTLLLSQSSFFWANTALFIYASGCFLLFLFGPYLFKDEYKMFILLWQTFFTIFNVQLNLLLGIAMYKKTNA
jgi:hypothetical protein